MRGIAKLPQWKVDTMKKLIETTDMTYADIARRLGVYKSTLYRYKKKHGWTRVDQES